MNEIDNHPRVEVDVPGLVRAAVFTEDRGGLPALARTRRPEALAQLFDSLGIGLCIVDGQSRIEIANGAARQMLQRSNKQIRGRSITTFFESSTPKARAQLRRRLRDSILAREPVRFQSILRSNGSEDLMVEAVTIPREDDTSEGALVVLVDVSAERRMKDALLRRDAILEAVHFASVQFLGALDWEHELPAMLERLGNATGVDRIHVFEKHLGNNGDIMAQHRFEWCSPGVTSKFAQPETRRVSYRRTGFARWLDILPANQPITGLVRDLPEVEQRPLRSLDMRSLSVVPIFAGSEWWGTISFDDCTRDRVWSELELQALTAAAATIGAAIRAKRDAAKLRELDQRYKRVVDRLHEVVFESDTEGRWRFLTPAWATITGYSVEETLGRSYTEFIHLDDLKAILEKYHAPVRTDLLSKFRTVHRFKVKSGGYRWVEVYASRTMSADGVITGTIGTLTDITESKDAEDERNALIAHQSRLEGVTLAGREMAHLINNDITAAVAAFELLTMKANLGDENTNLVKQALNGLHSAAEHMRQFQKIVRVETRATATGAALDLKRSSKRD